MNSAKALIKKLFEKDLYFFLLLCFALLGIYSQLIIKDTILSYDDSILLQSLRAIKNLEHYFQSVKSGFILDIQPIRDLSYFIDFKLKSLLPFYSFHLTNTLIWILICFNIRKIFLYHTKNSFYVIGLIVLVYALSPISANSVAWIAARKHLLSAFFISLSTLIISREIDNLRKRYVLLISISFFLSCFSQPINSLWIIWLTFFCYKRIKNKNIISLLLINTLISLSSLGINFYYYKFIFAKAVTTNSKFVNSSTFDLGDPLLALGRYFYQNLNPFAALPSPHYQGSWENLLGLLLLVMFLSFCYKKMKETNYALVSSLLYFIFPLVIVTLNMTNIFCSDTYMLTSSVGFYWSFLLLTEKLKNQKLVIYLLSSYVFVIGIYTSQYIKMFNNEADLWIYSQNKEATSQTTAIVASVLTQQQKFRESFVLIEELQNRWPNQPFIPQLIAENLFYNPKIPIQIKIKHLLEVKPRMPSTYLYLSILYGYQNDKNQLESFIHLIFADPMKFSMEFHGSETKIAAIYLYTCEYFKISECRIKFERFKKTAGYSDWNEEEIIKNINTLKKFKNYQINI